MSNRTRSERLAVVFGIVLIVFGVLALFGDGSGAIVLPFVSTVHAIQAVAWPLLLVVLGAVLLSRARTDVAAPGARPEPGRRVYRSRHDRIVTGVMGGLAAYLNAPAWLVRTVFVIATLSAGIMWGLVVYVAATLLVPEAPPATVTSGGA